MVRLARITAFACLLLITAATGADARSDAPAPPAETDGAAAQPVDMAILMTPGPLGEKALGDPKAPVTLIEYASLTCSHCGNFYRAAFAGLKSKYIDTGKVYYILREYPLDALAMVAAMVARCSTTAPYFTIIDRMFTEQDKWAYVAQPGEALFQLVKPFGFTTETFEGCVNDEKIQNGIFAVAEQGGEKLGVDRTPTFFFNGVRRTGELTSADLDAILAPLLAATQP